MRLIRVFGTIVFLALPVSARAETIVVYAAGSLRAPLSDIARRFEAQSGAQVRLEFGASGLLKDRIIAGEPAQVFASANTEHPAALVKSGNATDTAVFARNKLCALASPSLSLSSTSLLDAMLEDRVKLGTSTPQADPSGAYAWESFRRADAVRPGSFDRLSHKALQLTAQPGAAPPTADRNVYGDLVENGKADIFLTYCTNAALAVREHPRLKIIEMPPELAVGAEYGVALLDAKSPLAREFIDFLRGEDGQSILRSYGFR